MKDKFILKYSALIITIILSVTLTFAGCRTDAFSREQEQEAYEEQQDMPYDELEDRAYHYALEIVMKEYPGLEPIANYSPDKVIEEAPGIYEITLEDGIESIWHCVLQYYEDEDVFEAIELVCEGGQKSGPEEEYIAEQEPQEEFPEEQQESLPEEHPPDEYPEEHPEETQPEEHPPEEPQQQQQVQNTNIPIVEGECGTLQENFPKAFQQGNYIFAGDSTDNKLGKGFISFNITSLSGCKVQFAALNLNCQGISNDPSFFGEFRISNAKNWGARPVQKGDYNRDDFIIQKYSAGGDGSVLCENSLLKDAIQNNINGNDDRFQIIISTNPVNANNPGRTNGISDGFVYFVDGINLYVEFVK